MGKEKLFCIQSVTRMPVKVDEFVNAGYKWSLNRRARVELSTHVACLSLGHMEGGTCLRGRRYNPAPELAFWKCSCKTNLSSKPYLAYILYGLLFQVYFLRRIKHNWVSKIDLSANTSEEK